MKKFILLFLFVTPLIAQAQEIPNGNFETWYFVGWSENPEFWITNNTELYPTVAKDYDSYEGDFAMRVTAEPTGLGEYGEASTQFEITAVPAALNFYAKSEVEFGGVGVTITFLNQDAEIYTEYWFSSENMEEYTLVSIPLDQIEPVISHVRIAVNAQVGDLVAGSAWISVDAMEFGEPLSIKHTELSTFKIYPNPASENLTIETVADLQSIEIFSITGKRIQSLSGSGMNKNMDVSGLNQGVYLLKFNTSNGSFVKRVVIQ